MSHQQQKQKQQQRNDAVREEMKGIMGIRHTENK